ncbi:hypothetical protein [Mesorhizobium sp. ES1-1]|uniref:hypothetical protein n=1 Tax=Mesorhizobium sp. ES1-1 TaxID=2876629 RepID=UPI001CCFD293|nr:hypothetical protein [Mesorhizobium sp. ES1-1]MBZ9676399.1 hypothetical protein [Mesorhizobium sp. ES1-1]
MAELDGYLWMGGLLILFGGLYWAATSGARRRFREFTSRSDAAIKRTDALLKANEASIEASLSNTKAIEENTIAIRDLISKMRAEQK